MKKNQSSMIKSTDQYFIFAKGNNSDLCAQKRLIYCSTHVTRVRRSRKQRPESATVTPTRHASTCVLNFYFALPKT